MSDALEYLAAAAVDWMRKAPTGEELSSHQALIDGIKKRYRVTLTDVHADMVARRLEQLGFIRRVTDHYAGTYFVPLGSINLLLRVSAFEKESTDTTFVRALEGGQRLFGRVFKNDQFWNDLNEDLEGDSDLVKPFGAHEEIPASDRVVTLSHNQQIDLEASSTELIDELSKENSIDGDASLKDRLLGQIRAGRELIRAQSIRAYLLHETLMTVLGGLVERYRGAAIGQAAKKLLDLLIEHIFGK